MAKKVAIILLAKAAGQWEFSGQTEDIEGVAKN